MAASLSAQVRAELENLRKRKGGKLLPEDTVEFAKNPKTALHKCFEWDDKIAGHEYRLQQARTIIVSVKTTREDSLGRAVPTRTYVSLTNDRTSGGGYRHHDDVMASDEMRQQLLRQAMRELQAFRNKYANLSALANVFKAIDKALETHPVH